MVSLALDLEKGSLESMGEVVGCDDALNPQASATLKLKIALKGEGVFSF